MMSKSKLFLYPSYFDAFPLTLIEAAMVGVPIVAYAHPAYTWFWKGKIELTRLGDLSSFIRIARRILSQPRKPTLMIDSRMRTWRSVFNEEWKLIRDMIA